MFFISDPGNFQACMSVDAIPVLPPCGDKLKRGAAEPRNEDRETLRGHCLIGANSASPNTAKAKPAGFLSRSPGGISVGICRTALVFPDRAHLPEAVSEACCCCFFLMLFPSRNSAIRDYLSTAYQATRQTRSHMHSSVRSNPHWLGSAQLCPLLPLQEFWGLGGGEV